MKLANLFTRKKKILIISALWLAAFFILLPNFVFIITNQQAPYSDDEVVITTVSYKSEGLPDGENNLIVGNLFQPAPKFSDKKYPAIIACHGFLYGIGKESMNRWCVELTKRGFVVLSIDLPGSGMSSGEMDLFPREDFEPVVVQDGVEFLKGYDFVDDSEIGIIGISYGGTTAAICGGVLGDILDASVCINGFYNATEWLIEEILPDKNFEFSVHDKYITLEKVDDKEVNKDNIKDILKSTIFLGEIRKISKML